MKYFQTQVYLSSFGCRPKNDSLFYEEQLLQWEGKFDEFDSSVIERNISLANKEKKQAHFEISDRSALKLDISISDIGSFIGIASEISIVSGFSYSYFFYKYFGINVSDYFNISDYLSSSIESLYIVFISAFISMAVMFLGAHNSSRRSPKLNEYDSQTKDYFTILSSTLLLLMLSSGVILGGSLLHSSISNSILLFGMIITPRIVRKYFTNYTHSLMSIMLVITFISHLYGKVYDEIYDFVDEKNLQYTCEVIRFKENSNLNIDLCKTVVLGANSTFVFLYEKSIERTYVVPRENISSSFYPADQSRNNPFEKLSNYVQRKLDVSE